MHEVNSVEQALILWGRAERGGLVPLQHKSIMQRIYDMGNSNGSRTPVPMDEFTDWVGMCVGFIEREDEDLAGAVKWRYLGSLEMTSRKVKCRVRRMSPRTIQRRLEAARESLAPLLNLPPK